MDDFNFGVLLGFLFAGFIKIINRHRFTIKFASKLPPMIYLLPSPTYFTFFQ